MLSDFGLRPGTAIYLGAILVGGILLLMRALFWLRVTQTQRTERLQQRRYLEAIKTSSPLEDSTATAKARGLESIDKHTTVTRRVVVPLVIGLMAILAALPFLGQLPAALLSVMVAAVTVFLGMAARPTVENAFAGLALAWSKQINIGDTVMLDELYGTVEDITVTHTTLRVWDWRRYVVPNSRMMQSNVINYSLNDRYLWACIEFWVAHDSDLDLVEQLALEAPIGSTNFVPHEGPSFWLMDIKETGIQCWLAAWADTPSSAWNLKHDMRRALLAAFRKHGIKTHGYRLEPSGGSPPLLETEARKPAEGDKPA
ncbi:MAG: mechanosensitive ion channel [Polyangiaceae bacterium]|nr:mechanosensitive ion channel [Polyangiaceae bacterium]